MSAQADGETLPEVLTRWVGQEHGRRPVAATIQHLVGAARAIGEQLALAPLVGGLSDAAGTNASGDTKKVFDDIANQMLAHALDEAFVAAYASEESETVALLNRTAPLVVAVDPLDGSGNLNFDAPLGVIFSIRPSVEGDATLAFHRPGCDQLAAGLVLFGAATMLALSVGEGTDLYVLDRDAGVFVRSTKGVRIPPHGTTYAVNGANARHWFPEFRAYVADLQAGADGSRGEDFNTRWYGALVMEVVRMLLEGGVYLYPADERPRFRSGLIRLVYEAHPVALLIEQAGGLATDGATRILDKRAREIHERTPMIFGSIDRVKEALYQLDEANGHAARAPLFNDRGLFRG
jgi:fructose-1,6-bisphosphatase I